MSGLKTCPIRELMSRLVMAVRQIHVGDVCIRDQCVWFIDTGGQAGCAITILGKAAALK